MAVLPMELLHYLCEIDGDSLSPCALNGGAVKCFAKPVTTAGIQKLYVVMAEGKFCYVGITSLPMAGRIRIGFKPDTTTGYHGYAWRKLKLVSLYVWMSSVDRKRTESIEAELVFQIRQRTGKWPLFQTEIHFSNPVGDVDSGDRGIAEQLFERLVRAE
jgi:hypothetical protein